MSAHAFVGGILRDEEEELYYLFGRRSVFLTLPEADVKKTLQYWARLSRKFDAKNSKIRHILSTQVNTAIAPLVNLHK